MSDHQPSRPPLRFRTVNILLGSMLIGLALFAGWRIFLGPAINADRQGYLPGFNPEILYGVALGSMILVGVLWICMPTAPGRSKPMADRLEDQRQYGVIFGKTRLPNWLAGLILLLIFVSFAALLWAAMWE